MDVVINGNPQTLEPDTTVKALLQALESDRPGVAVAVDGKVVPRSRHAETPLHAGAKIEVIRAVGGG